MRFYQAESFIKSTCLQTLQMLLFSRQPIKNHRQDSSLIWPADGFYLAITALKAISQPNVKPPYWRQDTVQGITGPQRQLTIHMTSAFHHIASCVCAWMCNSLEGCKTSPPKVHIGRQLDYVRTHSISYRSIYRQII